MAGMSSRFSNAGYELPKYMLQAHGKSLFSFAIESFRHYFNNTEFLFIARDIDNTENFINKEVINIGIKNFSIVILNNLTSGQAETVYLGLEKAKVHQSKPISIFNIDTYRKNFTFPHFLNLNKIDGFLEVFIGKGENWSYVKPGSKLKNSVLETSEKRPISNLCCTGFYHFKNVELFNKTFKKYSQDQSIQLVRNELFIAPMYNLIINSGGDIRYQKILKKDIFIFGTPEEYENFKKTKII